jgi:hypothetical protein
MTRSTDDDGGLGREDYNYPPYVRLVHYDSDDVEVRGADLSTRLWVERWYEALSALGVPIDRCRSRSGQCN